MVWLLLVLKEVRVFRVWSNGIHIIQELARNANLQTSLQTNQIQRIQGWSSAIWFMEPSTGFSGDPGDSDGSPDTQFKNNCSQATSCPVTKWDITRDTSG